MRASPKYKDENTLIVSRRLIVRCKEDSSKSFFESVKTISLINSTPFMLTAGLGGDSKLLNIQLTSIEVDMQEKSDTDTITRQASQLTPGTIKSVPCKERPITATGHGDLRWRLRAVVHHRYCRQNRGNFCSRFAENVYVGLIMLDLCSNRV